VLIGLLVLVSGCGNASKGQVGAQPAPNSQQGGPISVDVAIARTGKLRDEAVYTGTTRPVREVLLRSQAEGQLLDLAVDVGDPVEQGQVLARLDDAVLVTAVVQAQAELAARESEVASAETEVSDARTQVEQARLQFQQAQADAARLRKLNQEGAIDTQAAEQAQTAARTAEQALRSAQEQVRTRQAAVTAARRRVAAQQAAVAGEQARLSYAVLASPMTGSVLERVTEPGNLVQPGSALLRLGDFQQIKVVVQVSELDLSKVRVGQSVRVTLDAFSNQEFLGRVSRIAPTTNSNARLIPVEVIIPNRTRQNASGLLARVSFARPVSDRVIVPQSALQEERGNRSRAASEKNSAVTPGTPSASKNATGDRASGDRPTRDRALGNRASGNRPTRDGIANPRSQQAILFVLNSTANPPTVSSRQVQIGEQTDGQVEILSGLKPGERFIVRSGQPLKDGAAVKFSILSES
jgi:multidrug efflux pump subunit AcrA (membrane-fusion protein)